jgi:hypothetical protein
LLGLPAGIAVQVGIETEERWTQNWQRRKCNLRDWCCGIGCLLVVLTKNVTCMHIVWKLTVAGTFFLMPVFKEMTCFKTTQSPKTADLWISNSKYKYKEPGSRGNRQS